MTWIEYAVTVASRSCYDTCQIRNRSLHVPGSFSVLLNR
jgi:hypothetical protein